ncbi:MAG: ABC transporter ATP-binding protein [Actinobacteria bacterium]|nr:MAG: ABC transporter ATP-binding protein [Actinomycetota bacterium]
MQELAIKTEGLGKQYRIGGTQARYKTLRESIVDGAKAPFKRMGRLFRGEAYAGTGLHESIWALKEISFEVKQGEVLGIIGRNGAGKTTLLKILSRITEPTEGVAEVWGKVGSLLEVGVGFHPELTGRENVFLNGAILGMRKAEIENKYDEIVDFAGVDKYIDTPMKHYSSGMQVRLAFSIAAHLEPEILLIDEVLAVGDIGFQRKCFSKMDEVAYAGRTVIFVSHNMEAIRSLCTRGVWLDEGKVVYEGDATSAINLYIESFSGESAVSTIAEESHVVDSGLLRIDKVSILDSEGRATSRISYREDFSIGLEIGILGTIEKARLGIGINSPGGQRITTVHHTDKGGIPLGVPPGRYAVLARFVNDLMPGLYVISVGAHEEDSGKSLDYIPYAIDLSIIGTSKEGESPDPANHGLVDMEVNWSEVERI